MLMFKILCLQLTSGITFREVNYVVCISVDNANDLGWIQSMYVGNIILGRKIYENIDRFFFQKNTVPNPDKHFIDFAQSYVNDTI